MILLGSYICYTTNTLDAIEAFIAETYVQLVATESMCYSTGDCSLAVCLPDCLALYCAVPYIAACVDVSRTVFRDRSMDWFCGKSLLYWNVNPFLEYVAAVTDSIKGTGLCSVPKFQFIFPVIFWLWTARFVTSGCVPYVALNIYAENWKCSLFMHIFTYVSSKNTHR